MRTRVIAVRISRAPVENARTSSPALARAAPPHKFAFIALRAFDAHGDRPRVLALRVARATDELAEAPTLLDQVVAAQRALFFERLVRLMRNARSLHQPPRGFAIRVTGASHECAKAPALDGHFLAAVFAILGLAFTAIIRKLRRHVLNKIAIRIPRAAQEKSMPADAFEQFAFAALLAFLTGRNSGLVRHHFVAGLRQIHHELFPELAHCHAP